MDSRTDDWDLAGQKDRQYVETAGYVHLVVIYSCSYFRKKSYMTWPCKLCKELPDTESKPITRYHDEINEKKQLQKKKNFWKKWKAKLTIWKACTLPCASRKCLSWEIIFHRHKRRTFPPSHVLFFVPTECVFRRKRNFAVSTRETRVPWLHFDPSHSQRRDVKTMTQKKLALDVKVWPCIRGGSVRSLARLVEGVYGRIEWKYSGGCNG